jgi:hypothetical protein
MFAQNANHLCNADAKRQCISDASGTDGTGAFDVDMLD